MKNKEKVVIVGASNNPERYSYKAMKLLEEHGHEVTLVHPREKIIEGHAVVSALSEIHFPVDTITMYVNPELSHKMQNELLTLKPKRVIFNPGTENPALAKALNEQGIQTENACTLVLLRTGQY